MPDPSQVSAPAPQPAAPKAPGAAPFGSSPATGPTPNRGFEVAGLQKLGLVLKQLEMLLPMLGSGSEAGKDVLKCINTLGKHVQPGTNSPASEKNQIEEMALKNAQRSQQVAQMRPQPTQQATPQPAAA